MGLRLPGSHAMEGLDQIGLDDLPALLIKFDKPIRARCILFRHIF
jgi:hypothetical protein